MNKLILTIVLFIFALPCFADYLPGYVDSSAFYGKGVILINDALVVYDKDDDGARPLMKLKNAEALKYSLQGVKNAPVEDVFSAYSKDKKLLIMPVEADTDDWYYVCYNQKLKLFGWVKKSENVDYASWEDFFNIYGRKFGVYIFRNADEKYKRLYSSPNGGRLVDDFYFAKQAALWLMSGDWMLVKVLTYDGKTKTGWMRWRLEDGTLIAFPDFN